MWTQVVASPPDFGSGGGGVVAAQMVAQVGKTGWRTKTAICRTKMQVWKPWIKWRWTLTVGCPIDESLN